VSASWHLLDSRPSWVRNSASYDSANYTPAQFISLVTGYLKPAMVSAGLTTKIAVPEPSVWGGPSYFDPNWGFPILQNQPQMDADVDDLAGLARCASSSLGKSEILAVPETLAIAPGYVQSSTGSGISTASQTALA